MLLQIISYIVMGMLTIVHKKFATHLWQFKSYCAHYKFSYTSWWFRIFCLPFIDVFQIRTAYFYFRYFCWKNELTVATKLFDSPALYQSQSFVKILSNLRVFRHILLSLLAAASELAAIRASANSSKGSIVPLPWHGHFSFHLFLLWCFFSLIPTRDFFFTVCS